MSRSRSLRRPTQLSTSGALPRSAAGAANWSPALMKGNRSAIENASELRRVWHALHTAEARGMSINIEPGIAQEADERDARLRGKLDGKAGGRRNGGDHGNSRQPGFLHDLERYAA